jgi:hypothetical protein
MSRWLGAWQWRLPPSPPGLEPLKEVCGVAQKNSLICPMLKHMSKINLNRFLMKYDATV